MRLERKVALITGAGSGIGRAMALLFAKEGAKVSVVDIVDSGGQETVKMIEQAGGTAQFIHADVTKAAEVENAIKATVKAYNKLDILCNNAGFTHRMKPVVEIDEATWDKTLAINLKGIFLGAKYAVPVMKKQGGGVIINTASISGVRPRPRLSAYSAAKGGAIMLTKELAIELAPDNIRVNSISPVGTDTPMLIDVFGKENLEEGKKAFIATVPLGRLGKVEDQANAALYLASDEANFLTGVNLEVDGGRGI